MKDPNGRYRTPAQTAALLNALRSALRPRGTILRAKAVHHKVRVAGHWCTISQVSSLMSSHPAEFNPAGGWHLRAFDQPEPGAPADAIYVTAHGVRVRVLDWDTDYMTHEVCARCQKVSDGTKYYVVQRELQPDR